MKQVVRTKLQFEQNHLAELDSHLRKFRKNAPDPVCSFYSLFASCYLHDSTDAVHDDLPGGYEDDFYVLHFVADRINLQQCNTETTRVKPFSRSKDQRAEASERPEHGLGANRDYLLEWLDRLIVLTSPKNLDIHLKSFEGIAKGVLTRYLRKVLPGSEYHSLVHHPSVMDTDAPLIGLFGRTSCGKTTLMRRMIQELSPAYTWVGDLLETTVEAHTTKIPFIIDFHKSSTAAWYYEGLEGRHDGKLNGKRRSRIRNICQNANAQSGFWFLIQLPAEHNLRVFDLPGLYGFESGPWAERASAVASRLDALVLPMDRRQVREEEKQTLVEALLHYPHTRCALSLWKVPDTSELASRRKFLEEKIYSWLPLSANVVGNDSCRLLWNRIQRMKMYSISKHTSGKDDMGSLIEWLFSIRPWKQRTSKKCYDDLHKLAQEVDSKKAVIAGRSLILIGILRALKTARIIYSSTETERG